MKIVKAIVLFTSITSLFFSCSQGEKKEDVKIEIKDSLVDKLNSPELKALNAQLISEPNNAELYNKRAKIYIALKQFSEAAGDGLRARDLDSTKADYYVTLADVYFASNQTRHSKEMLEAAVKKFPESTEALLKLAELYFIVKQYENSLAFINKALKIDDHIAKAYYLKGSVYKEAGDTSKAISSMITAVEQDNKYFDAFFDLGILHAVHKNPMAFEYYDNALRVKPNNPEVIYAKAKLLQDLNKIDESILLYENLLTVNKDDEHALYNLGAIYLDRKKETKKAIDYFSKAVTVNPKYTEAYFARGVCFQLLKDKNSALADFNMSLQITPNYEPSVEALNEMEKKK
jgi:tetratricopeptide (TPR) repeat protein